MRDEYLVAKYSTLIRIIKEHAPAIYTFAIDGVFERHKMMLELQGANVPDGIDADNFRDEHFPPYKKIREALIKSWRRFSKSNYVNRPGRGHRLMASRWAVQWVCLQQLETLQRSEREILRSSRTDRADGAHGSASRAQMGAGKSWGAARGPWRGASTAHPKQTNPAA